jgi:hypothetical protein
MTKTAKIDVVENAKLCVDHAWKASFHFISGEVVEGAHITGTNWDLGYVQVEKIGERHLPPRLIDLSEVHRVEVIWS